MWRSNSKKFDIDRLYVIAGPRSCGKTTFLKGPANHLTADDLPDSLRLLVDDPPSMCGASKLTAWKGKKLQSARLHVDLVTPLDEMDAFGPDDFSLLSKKIYEDWDALGVISQAREVHFVTLFLPRRVLFRRWMERIDEPSRELVKKNVVTLYGDLREDAGALRALYQAWVDYAETFDHQGHHGLDVSAQNYQYHPKFTSDLVTDQ